MKQTQVKTQKQQENVFKSEVRKKLDMLMNDDYEWEIYQDQMSEKIKQRYIRDVRNPNISIDSSKQRMFLAGMVEDADIEYDFAQHKSDTQKIYRMQKRFEAEGDFINLNKLQIRNGNHDQISRLK